MRKFISSLLCAFLLTGSFVVPVLAQDSPLTPPVLCGELDEADCSILESSAAAMQGVSAYAFDVQYNVLVTGLPEMEVEAVDLTVGVDGVVQIDPEVMAALQEIVALGVTSDAEAMMAAMTDMPAILLDFYAALGFDGTIQITMPAELAALLSEDSEVPMPADLTLAFRIVDGMFYMQISNLKEMAPDLAEIPEDWIGFDLVGLMEQSLAQSSAGQIDESELAQSMIMAGLSNQILAVMEPFVTVERTDDVEVSGQTAAVFISTVDLVEFFSSDEFIDFVRETVAAIGVDDEETTAQLDEGLPMMGFLAPMIFGGMEIENEMAIGLDDFYLYAQDFLFRWDLSQIMGLAAMSDPSLAEAMGDAEPVIEFSFTTSFDQFGEEFELAPPDSVQIIPLDELAPEDVEAVF